MSIKSPDHIFAITPSDSATIRQTKFIMVTSEGDVAVETSAGFSAVMPGLVPGVQYAISAVKVLATDTTADGIIGLS